MVKLDAMRIGRSWIVLSVENFEHLLNCLDNQKSKKVKYQEAIDDFNRQCREFLNKEGKDEYGCREASD